MNGNLLLIKQLNILVEEELIAIKEGALPVALDLQDRAIAIIKELLISKETSPNLWNSDYQVRFSDIETKIRDNMSTLDSLKLKASDELDLIKQALSKLSEVQLNKK